MSSAALAKKRRAVPQQPVQQPIQNTQSQQAASAAPSGRVPVTIPQMFALMERRISSVEKDVREYLGTKEESESKDDSDSFKKLTDEYESRFELLAIEMNSMKDLLMKLQSFTMDVNKVLLERTDMIEPSLIETEVLETIEEDE
jgi:hypothetical protein